MRSVLSSETDQLAAAFVTVGYGTRAIFCFFGEKAGGQKSEQAISHAIGDEYFAGPRIDGYTGRMNQVAARALDNSSWRNVSIVINVPHAHKTWRAGVPGRRQVNVWSQIFPGHFKCVRRVILVIDCRDEDFSERRLNR